MATTKNLLQAYKAMRIAEALIDIEIAKYQQDPETSEIDQVEYEEIYHAYNCMTDAEAAFFGGLTCLNERKLEEDEDWVDLENAPEMQISLGRHSKCDLKAEENQQKDEK